MFAVSCALVLAGGGVWLYSTREENERLRAEVERLRGAAAVRPPAERPSPLPARTGGTHAATSPPVSGSSPETGAQKGQSGENGKEENGGPRAMVGADLKDIEKRGATRIAVLRERLRLRPDQVATLEKRAAERAAATSAALQRVQNRAARPPDLGILVDWMTGRFDIPVSDLIDDEQRELFAAFDADDRTSRLEFLVGAELMEISGEAGIVLTAAQKDEVFAKLTQIIAEEDALGESYYADDEGFTARVAESLQRRKDALRGVFSPEQQTAYERALDADAALIAEWFPAQK